MRRHACIWTFACTLALVAAPWVGTALAKSDGDLDAKGFGDKKWKDRDFDRKFRDHDFDRKFRDHDFDRKFRDHDFDRKFRHHDFDRKFRDHDFDRKFRDHDSYRRVIVRHYDTDHYPYGSLFDRRYGGLFGDLYGDRYYDRFFYPSYRSYRSGHIDTDTLLAIIALSGRSDPRDLKDHLLYDHGLAAGSFYVGDQRASQMVGPYAQAADADATNVPLVLLSPTAAARLMESATADPVVELVPGAVTHAVLSNGQRVLVVVVQEEMMAGAS